MIPGKQELNQMASPQLALAAQINGRKSRGPITPEGKRKSSANSRKHGLRSKTLPTDDACEAHRQWLLPHLIAQHSPATPIEFMLVETIAQASARQDWAIRISDGYHAEAIQHQSSPEAPYKHPGRHAIELLHRAFSRFAREERRALQQLRQIQSLTQLPESQNIHEQVVPATISAKRAAPLAAKAPAAAPAATPPPKNTKINKRTESPPRTHYHHTESHDPKPLPQPLILPHKLKSKNRTPFRQVACLR
jgi:hypothetical protein